MTRRGGPPIYNFSDTYVRTLPLPGADRVLHRAGAEIRRKSDGKPDLDVADEGAKEAEADSEGAIDMDDR